MKKLMTALALTFTVFTTKAAFTVIAPIPSSIIGISLSALNGAGLNASCAFGIPAAGYLYSKDSFVEENMNIGERIFNLTLGIMLLDQETGSTELKELDLNNLPDSISKSDANTYNNVKDDFLQIIEESATELAKQKENPTGNDYLEAFNQIVTQTDLTQEERDIFLKVLRTTVTKQN